MNNLIFVHFMDQLRLIFIKIITNNNTIIKLKLSFTFANKFQNFQTFT